MSLVRRLVLALAALALSGCAVVNQARMAPGQRLDPWENWNRKVFAFNEKLDEHVLKPVATAYVEVVPKVVRTTIGNVIGNVRDGWSSVNHLLQGKGTSGFEMLSRFGMNTVFGFGGILDIASEAGIDRQPEDFGQTLGRWGVGAGAYIVWPVFGPSTVRDTAALPFDRLASPAVVFNDHLAQFEVVLIELVDTRAQLLGASRVIDDIALDKYTFVRDAYLARRRSLVYDGDAPEQVDPAGKDEPAADKPAPSEPKPAPAR